MHHEWHHDITNKKQPIVKTMVSLFGSARAKNAAPQLHWFGAYSRFIFKGLNNLQ